MPESRVLASGLIKISNKHINLWGLVFCALRNPAYFTGRRQMNVVFRGFRHIKYFGYIIFVIVMNLIIYRVAMVYVYNGIF